MIPTSITVAPDGTVYGLTSEGKLVKWNPSLKSWVDA